MDSVGFRPGKLIAERWRVIAELESGHGPSYRVQDEKGRDVELLVMNLDSAMLDKARKLKSLLHENITSVLDLGRHEGWTYLVRELVTGQNVRGWLEKDGRLGYDQALGIACQLCLASTASARAGFPFLGFNPEGVWITADGFAKVDPLRLFPLENDKDYLAPEEAKNENPTQKSDIFRIGMMLNEMLLGRLPQRNGFGSVVFMPLTGIDPSLSMALDEAVKKALSTHPAERYIDAEAFLDRLHPLLMSRPRPTSAGPPKWHEDKRFWLYVAIALGALAIILSLITGLLPFPFGN